MPISAAHPKFLIDHVIERCRFQGIEPRIDLESIRDAVEELMVEGERRRSTGGAARGRTRGAPWASVTSRGALTAKPAREALAPSTAPPVPPLSRSFHACEKRRISGPAETNQPERGSGIMISGSAGFRSGQMVSGQEPDWSFVRDVREVEFQLLDPPRSRTTWILEHAGKVYIPCGYMDSSWGRLWKQWPLEAERDGRAILRIGDALYERELVRIGDAPLLAPLLDELG